MSCIPPPPPPPPPPHHNSDIFILQALCTYPENLLFYTCQKYALKNAIAIQIVPTADAVAGLHVVTVSNFILYYIFY